MFLLCVFTILRYTVIVGAVEDPVISGLVRDDLGNPLPNVLVVAQDSLTKIEVASSTTNVAGEYDMSVPASTYNLLVTPPLESGFANTTITDIEVTADVVIEIFLVPAQTIAFGGVVVDRDGSPVPNVAMQVYSNAMSATNLTDEHGFFSMRVAPGSYSLQVYGGYYPSIPNFPNYFSLYGTAALNLAEDTSMNFTLENRYLSGRVVDPYGSPVANVSIYAYGWTSFDNLYGECSSYATSDSQGRFNVSVFTCPSVTLRATPPARYAPVSITVNATEDKTIIIALVYQPDFPPIADFTWSPLVPVAGEVVTFNASSSTPDGGEIVSYEWAFGDSYQGSGEIVSHQYTAYGDFTVTLNVTDSEGKWDVEQKQIHVEAPPIYTLTIDSLPSGIEFTVDDLLCTTPWADTYFENTSVSVTMPETHVVGAARYYWSQWSDGNTSSSRTIVMTADIALTAQYVGPYCHLTVASSPVIGVAFTINGTLQTTTYSEWLLQGPYTLLMPETHDGYVWSHWLEDGDTNRVKTINLPGTTWTAVYEETPPVVGGTSVSITSSHVSAWVASVLLMFLAIIAVATSIKHPLHQNRAGTRLTACGKRIDGRPRIARAFPFCMHESTSRAFGYAW